MAAAKRAFGRQIGTIGAVGLALGAILLYSVWGASVLSAQKQAISQPISNLAVNQK